MNRNSFADVSNRSVREGAAFAARVVVLTLLAYLFVRVPQVGVGGLLDAAAPYWVAKLLLDVVVLGYVAVRSRWTGAKLVAALAVVYTGLKVVSLGEVYLYGMIGGGDVLAAIALSLVEETAIVLLVVAAFGRLRGEEVPPPDDRLRLSPVQWAWKLPLLAAFFLVTMILAGVAVFTPIAQVIDPVALANYGIFEETPAWVLPFQLLRGVVFTAILLPVVYAYRGDLGETRLAVATLFAVLLGSYMIAGHDAVPGLLWVAHFVELASQAFVYGLVAVTLLGREHHPLRGIRGRRAATTDDAGEATRSL